jgi:hypothetical protein
MHPLMTAGRMAIVAAALLAAGGAANPAAAQALSVVMDCGASSSVQIRTNLYFGMLRPKGGSVSELEWQLFLRDEVTKRFPDGLTVWDAQGQWRGPGGHVDHEQSKVLLIVHPDTPVARQSIQDIIAAYRKAFEQESVLWESARVCVAG